MWRIVSILGLSLLLGIMDVLAVITPSAGTGVEAEEIAGKQSRPKFRVFPQNIQFPKLNLLSPSPERASFAIINVGQVSGEVTVGSPSAPFVVSAGGSFTLAPGQSHTVAVSFQPSTAGLYQSSVEVDLPSKVVQVHLKGRATGQLRAAPLPTMRPTQAPATPTPTGTPTPTTTKTATPTATPSGSATPLTTSDSLLNIGSLASAELSLNVTQASNPNNVLSPASSLNVDVTQASNPNNVLWQLNPNPWGISSGSGTLKMSYSGAGAITTTVNMSGLNTGAVIAYPFIFYGGDPFGDQIGGQPPQFPEALTNMSSLNVDVKYNLAVNSPPGDLDVLFDEWLIPTASYTGGISGALEVKVLPYFNFVDGQCCTTVKTFTAQVTLNGAPQTLSFTEQIGNAGQPAGGNAILFRPNSSIQSGELQFNMLDFLAEAANTAGVPSWSVAGFELGTEFGGSATENYTFTVNKFEIQETLASP